MFPTKKSYDLNNECYYLQSKSYSRRIYSLLVKDFGRVNLTEISHFTYMKSAAVIATVRLRNAVLRFFCAEYRHKERL